MASFRLASTLTLMLALGAAPLAQAQTASSTTAASTRAHLHALAQALAAPAQTKAAPASTPLSTAEVADHALGLFENAVGSIAQTAKTIAPEVWRVMILQQYATAAASSAVLLFAWVFVFAATYAIRQRPKDTWRDPDLHTIWTLVIPGVFLFVNACGTLIVLPGVIQHAINPEYYALHDLVQLVLNPKAL